MKLRGFEIAKGWEDKGINLPKRSTAHAAGYDIEAAEDIIVPVYKPGIKPTLIPTGLKAYCQPDECYFLLSRSGGPKKGLLTPHGFGLIDSDYYENETNDGHFMVQVFNCSDHDLEIKKGTPIAQVMFTKYLMVDNDVAGGVRKGGFGSTDNNEVMCSDGTIKSPGLYGEDGSYMSWDELVNLHKIILDGTIIINVHKNITGELVIPEGITSTSERAFKNSKLESVVLPKRMTTIEAYSFAHSCLQSITIPKSVRLIEEWAFYDTYPSDVYYEGTEEEWNAIINDNDYLVDPYFDPLEEAIIHYNYKG